MNNEEPTQQARKRVLQLREKIGRLDENQLDLIFREARTFNAWQNQKVEESILQQLYQLMSIGPTCANILPARLVFVSSPAGRERLKPLIAEQNREKSMAAPVTAIVAHDLAFHATMARTFPLHPEFSKVFENDAQLAEEYAFRNGSLQGGYLIIAARALGLDCGPMSGFDNAGVDKEFFPNSSVRSNFLCNIGYGDTEGVFPRFPRLDFDEACQVI